MQLDMLPPSLHQRAVQATFQLVAVILQRTLTDLGDAIMYLADDEVPSALAATRHVDQALSHSLELLRAVVQPAKSQ